MLGGVRRLHKRGKMFLGQWVLLAASLAAALRPAALEKAQEVDRLAEPTVPSSLAKHSVGVLQSRGKKGGGTKGAILNGAMMLALGLAALAALSGKAAAASMAALMLAAVSLMKKGSEGGHASYEVVTHHGRRGIQDVREYPAAYAREGLMN